MSNFKQSQEPIQYDNDLEQAKKYDNQFNNLAPHDLYGNNIPQINPKQSFDLQNNQIINDNLINQSKPPQPNAPLAHLDESLYGNARVQFIKKVYMILLIQLSITVGFCFLSYYCRPFLEFQIYNQWLMWVLLAIMIITEIVIFCFPAGRKHPWNLIFLLLFTICQSYVVSYICSLVAYKNGAATVIVAAIITIAIVVGLTIYAFFVHFTGRDFLMLWGIAVVIVFSMFTMGIISIFTYWSPFLTNLYCALGVILFGIYIVYDTKMIAGGGNSRIQLGLDDYVIGALLLYIDIIQMFLYLLVMLGGRR